MVTCFYKFEVLVFSVGRKEVYSWKIVKTKIFSEITEKTAEGILGKKKTKTKTKKRSCFRYCPQVIGYLKNSCVTYYIC